MTLLPTSRRGWILSFARPLFILCVVVGALIAAVRYGFPEPDYVRFMEEKDQRYYSDLARACDLVLQQHPLGTNATAIQIVGSDVPEVFIRIPGNDPSLPQIIRDFIGRVEQTH